MYRSVVSHAGQLDRPIRKSVWVNVPRNSAPDPPYHPFYTHSPHQVPLVIHPSLLSSTPLSRHSAARHCGVVASAGEVKFSGHLGNRAGLDLFGKTRIDGWNARCHWLPLPASPFGPDGGVKGERVQAHSCTVYDPMYRTLLMV